MTMTQLKLRAFPGIGAGSGRFLGRVEVLVDSTGAFSSNRRTAGAPAPFLGPVGPVGSWNILVSLEAL